jgi:Zc3h12a-like Ribonuclease NYN domain/S1 RNA binding domain
MPARHVVVDGSNMATEGSSLPSLRQLDEAVREYLIEYPDDIVTVVVDATFGHRIPPEERKRFEEAESGGEIVSPPAGAIGRGDAFLLRVADKVGAVVLSNDSFQEFHGEYEWLFDKGRLIGGKPVPGVGWIFTPRTPVRGPKSRESVKEAKRKRHAEKAEEPTESGLDMAAERSRGHGGDRKLQRAIAAAVEEAVEPAKGGRKRRRRRRGGEVPSEPLNEPFNFITFIAAHQLGDEVEGTVEEFSSHGAFISVDGARCYLPLSAMGEIPPRSAREVLRKGERRAFVVQAFDAMRRGIELALPGFARPAGTPTAETIDAEIHRGEGVDGIAQGGPSLELVRAETAPATSPPAPRRGGERTVKKPSLEQVVPKPGVPKPVVPKPAAAAGDGAAAKRPATKREGAPVKAVRANKATAAAKSATGKGPVAKRAATGTAATATVEAAGSGAAGAPGPRPVAAKAHLANAGQPAKKQTAKKQPAQKQPAQKETMAKSPGKTAAVGTSTTRSPKSKTPATRTPDRKAATTRVPATASTTAKAATGAATGRSSAAGQPRAAKTGTSKTSPAKTARASATAAKATAAAGRTSKEPAQKASGPIASTARKSRSTSSAPTKKASSTTSSPAKS